MISIIHDSRLPLEILRNLKKYGDCIPFHSHSVTHESLSGHPDIFLYIEGDRVIAAPNTPAEFIERLKAKGLKVRNGNTDVGDKKHNSTPYNVAGSGTCMIHHRKFTDPVILDSLKEREFIHVSQPFTRCSLLVLEGHRGITSDREIEKVLTGKGWTICYVRPEEILLPGVSYGFIGGCMGLYANKVFILGSLGFHPDGSRIEEFLRVSGYEIVELYRGKLFDGGSLFFTET